MAGHEEIDPHLVPEVSMPPPPPGAAAGQLHNQGTELEQASRRGVRRGLRERSVESVNSTFTKITDAESYSDRGATPTHNAKYLDQVRFGTGSSPRSSTARSQDTETPAKRIARSRLMKTLLQRLRAASDDLRSHLAIEAKTSDDADGDTWRVELNSYRQAFYTYQANYVDGENFIDADWALSIVEAPEGSPDWDTASRVLAAANAVALLDSLIDSDPRYTLHHLQRWDQIFPRFFCPKGEWNRPEWMEAYNTFEHSLQIRTQLLMMTLRRLNGPEHDPFTLAANIFCSDGVGGDELRAFLTSDEDKPILFRSLAGVDLNDEHAVWLRERYSAQLRDLCLLLEGPGNRPDLQRLEADHPFDAFTDSLKDWAHACYEDTRSTLDLRGSAPSFMTPDEASVVASQYGSQDSRSVLDESAGSVGSVAGLSQVQLLKQLEHQFGASPQPAQTAQLITTEDVLRRRQQLQARDYDSSSYTQPSPSQDSRSLYPEQALEGGSEGLGTAYAGPAASMPNRKSRRSMEDVDDFETDSRGPDNQRRIGGPRVKRVYLAHSPTAHSMHPRTSDGEALVKGPQSSYMDPDLAALSQKSREVTMAARKPKGPQVRIAWSRHDCGLLIKAVDTHKCRWSMIERDILNGTIPFERPRDQQALRDKARLLKQDFLKTDGVLPPGFDLVVLGKKEREAVIQCGKNPERREADLDDMMRPIHTEHLGEPLP